MFIVHQLGTATQTTAVPIIRYRADDLPPGTAAPTSWANTGSTGSTHNLTLPGANTAPALNATGGAGNRAFVRFAAPANAFQTTANFPISGSAARTFLLVVRCPNLTRGYFSFGSPNVLGSNWSFANANGRYDLGMAGRDMYPPGFRGGFWQIIALWGEGNSQAYNVSFRADARNQFDQTFADINTVATPLTLGTSNHVAQTANLDIAEFQAFSGVLSDGEIAAQMQALATYYALPL